jgi:hypothetical protein
MSAEEMQLYHSVLKINLQLEAGIDMVRERASAVNQAPFCAIGTRRILVSITSICPLAYSCVCASRLRQQSPHLSVSRHEWVGSGQFHSLA